MTVSNSALLNPNSWWQVKLLQHESLALVTVIQLILFRRQSVPPADLQSALLELYNSHLIIQASQRCSRPRLTYFCEALLLLGFEVNSEFRAA